AERCRAGPRTSPAACSIRTRSTRRGPRSSAVEPDGDRSLRVREKRDPAVGPAVALGEETADRRVPVRVRLNVGAALQPPSAALQLELGAALEIVEEGPLGIRGFDPRRAVVVGDPGPGGVRRAVGRVRVDDDDLASLERYPRHRAERRYRDGGEAEPAPDAP